jgi:type III secretory pathway component EscS
VKVPLKAAAVGLLLGILITFVLEPETLEGTALLIIISTLMVMIVGWILEAVLRTPRP